VTSLLPSIFTYFMFVITFFVTQYLIKLQLTKFRKMFEIRVW